jgi:Patatin-like phospholipase
MPLQGIKMKNLLIIYALILSLSVFILTGCMEYVKARVWETPFDSNSFPEMSGELSVPWLAKKPSFGIAFSGGGTRSASATLGQLRALNRLGWLKKARYISAVSGGSWAAVPYIYLPEKYDDDSFLGEYYPPEELYGERFTELEKDSLAEIIGNVGHLAPEILLYPVGLSRDETYSKAIGKNFLEPLDLEDRYRFFTFHSKALNNILADNNCDGVYKSTCLNEDDFILIDEKKERPYLLVGATLLDPWKGGEPKNIYPVEITPLYTGIRGTFETDEELKHDIGGGYVESFAYDTMPPNNPLKIKERQAFYIGLKSHRFSLSDMIGTSGAAPEKTLSEFYAENFGLPEYRYWPVRIGKEVVSKETHHGDGGHLDYVGIMPLLARHVEKILVFVNTPTPFSDEKNNGKIDKTVISSDVLGYFGQNKKEFPDNGIIEKSKAEAELNTLYSAFQKQKQSSEPLVYCQNYQIVKNDRFAIESKKKDGSSYIPTICWVYLDRTEKWLDLIEKHHCSDQNVSKLISKEAPFKNFPHYKTFFDQKGRFQVIGLDAEQVNALSQLTAWTVLENSEYLSKNLGLEIGD